MFSSPSGEDHLLIWDALFDLDYGNHLALIIRLRADDGEWMSFWAATDPFDLNIAAPPNEEPEGDIFPPGEVNETDNIMIQMEVTDDTDSDDLIVTLYYRNGNNGSWDDVEMDHEGDDIFEATIPNAYITGTLVQYYIEIDDGDNVVYAEDKDDDDPMTVTIFKEEDTGGEKSSDDSDPMMFIIIIVVIGAGGAVGMLLFFKKKGGGGKATGKEDIAQPGAGFQPTLQQQPPGAAGAPPHAHGAQPQGGAQMSVCPVCGAPVMVPPQRPVRVACNRCHNSFDVK